MKKLLRLPFLLLLVWSCNTNEENYEIQGQIEIANGTTIFRIAADDNNQPKILDSVAVKEGSFMIKGPIEEPDINFIQIQGQPGNFPIILEGCKIQVTLYKDSLSASIAKGTISNDDFMKYGPFVRFNRFPSPSVKVSFRFTFVKVNSPSFVMVIV